MSDPRSAAAQAESGVPWGGGAPTAPATGTPAVDPRTAERAAESGVPWVGDQPGHALDTAKPIPPEVIAEPQPDLGKTLPPPPTQEQQHSWEVEAQQKGVKDTFSYAQQRWMQTNNLRAADIAERQVIMANITKETGPVGRSAVIPVEAKLTQKDYNNEPSVYQHEGVDYYAPKSIMYQNGFRSSREYQLAQTYGTDYGPHSGESKPTGGIVVTDNKGKQILYFTQKRVDRALADHNAGGGKDSVLVSFIQRGQYLTAGETVSGAERLLTPKQVNA